MLLNASKYRSSFGGLWTDMANSHEEVQARLEVGAIDADEAQLLDFWIDKGYVIIPNAVPHDVIDKVISDFQHAWEILDGFVKVGYGSHGTSSLDPSKRKEPGYRLLDLYALYPACLEAMFATKIRRFLEIVFEQEILAFQSISFERGTQQALHQDPAYVVLSSPMKLAATWIALEDIQPGSGELSYYEGSHKIEEFLFKGIYKHWDGIDLETHLQFLELLHTKSQNMNLPLKKFQPKKGDVLIWSADLVHGGSEITHPNPHITRQSLVTHYCPYDTNPNYFRLNPETQIKVEYKPGCYYSSYYYPLLRDETNSKLNSDFTIDYNIAKLKEEIAKSKCIIASMESSKFWKIRKAWFKLKKALRITSD
jgi:phytanoyl-CoA hydroxylase